MVLHEVTRNATPSSEAIRRWVKVNRISIITTRTYQRFQAALGCEGDQVRKANLGELAIQEAMHEMALNEPEHIGIFLWDSQLSYPRQLSQDQYTCLSPVSRRQRLDRLGGKG